MTTTLPDPPDFLTELAYLPRVTRRDGRAIEEALAGPTLFDEGVRIRGAVVEATYASDDPPLLKRLRENEVPQLVEPQTLRFTGRRFLEVESLMRLPYAPSSPIEAGELTPLATRELATGVMRFQQQHRAACYVTASLPYLDRDIQASLRANDRLLGTSCDANGRGDLDRRPILAHVAPGRQALKHPRLIINRLLDHPIDAVYVEAQRLDPVRDSLEKLALFTEFLLGIRAANLPVFVARVGAFGLVLQALGIQAFDSGLGQAERTDLAALNRPLPEQQKGSPDDGPRGGRRIYLEPLKTTLRSRDAARILSNETLRGRFVCNHGCCRHVGFEALPERSRQHYLWARDHEVQELRSCPTPAARRDRVHEQLRDARETARLVRRAAASGGLPCPRFDHLDRWIGLLAREQALPAVAG